MRPSMVDRDAREKDDAGLASNDQENTVQVMDEPLDNVAVVVQQSSWQRSFNGWGRSDT